MIRRRRCRAVARSTVAVSRSWSLVVRPDVHDFRGRPRGRNRRRSGVAVVGVGGGSEPRAASSGGVELVELLPGRRPRRWRSGVGRPGSAKVVIPSIRPGWCTASRTRSEVQVRSRGGGGCRGTSPTMQSLSPVAGRCGPRQGRIATQLPAAADPPTSGASVRRRGRRW